MQIFEKTHHPTRYQIANICDMLNSLACRKDKKPLEPYNIQYWFKNARAALRRKLKGGPGSGAQPGSNGDDENELDDDLEDDTNTNNNGGDENDLMVQQILSKKSPPVFDLFGGGASGGRVKSSSLLGNGLEKNNAEPQFAYEDSNFSDYEDEVDNDNNDDDDGHNMIMLPGDEVKAGFSCGGGESLMGRDASFNDNNSVSGKI